MDFIKYENSLNLSHGDIKYNLQIIGDINHLENYTSILLITKIIHVNTENILKSTLKINICFAYSTRNDLINRIKLFINNKNTPKILKIDSIDKESLLLIKEPNSFIDVYNRTSNVSRLSDFMLWHINNSIINFEPCNWPQVSLIFFIKIIFMFNMYSVNK